ncbi:hypothetical protein N7527_010045 [Penicillium freii]|nr:hypothetical protein N7527_010045 [Penicillium freii]
MPPTIVSHDYYAILGIPQSANSATIKSTYRRLALAKHPDRRENEPNATAEFQLRAQLKYETAFDLVDFEDDDWEPFRFPGDNAIPNRQDQALRDVNILTVFPCISLVKDGDRDPLTQIVQLRSTQKLCMEAVYEASQMSTSFVVPRRSSTRSRRKSIAQNTDRPNGASFLEGKSPKP